MLVCHQRADHSYSTKFIIFAQLGIPSPPDSDELL